MIARLLRHTAQLERLRTLGHLGWLRGAIGAALGMAGAGAIGLVALGPNNAALPWLAAPFGASAVLVFVLPASPLAQPWPLIGGNLISAACGLAAGHLIGAPLPAAAVGVGVAIGAMSLTRSLHPPGGGFALLFALGATSAAPWGLSHLGVAFLNAVSLAVIGWAYNGMTGHPWPHRAPKAVPATPAEARRSSRVQDAIHTVLANWDEVIDADVDDLDAIFRAVQRELDRRG